MRPFARGTEVLLTSIKPDGEHGLAHAGANIIGLVLALGHEGLLGCCQSHARREEEEDAARHRALPTTRSPDGRRRAVDASQRWRAAHSAVGGQPLLRQPCVACVDGAVQAIRAKQALCPAAALVRVGIAFAPGSLLKLAFASVLHAASARSPLK